MKVVIENNGAETEHPVGSYAKTIYEDVVYFNDGEIEDHGELHINCTPEGLVVDVIDDQSDIDINDDAVVLTRSLTVTELLTLLFER